MKERKLFSRRELPLLAVFLLLCALGFWLLSRQPVGTVAVVEQNGEEILRQPLSQLDAPLELPLEGENHVSLTLVLSPSGAEIAASTCPDQVCVRTGKLTKAGESALCLPAGVSLRLEGAEGPDAETY